MGSDIDKWDILHLQDLHNKQKLCKRPMHLIKSHIWIEELNRPKDFFLTYSFVEIQSTYNTVHI